jgi:hypothetical protein
MDATFEEIKQDDLKIRYGQGGYRPNSGPKPYSDRRRVWFMLPKHTFDRLRQHAKPGGMSKFVIQALDRWDWDNVPESNFEPILKPEVLHVRLPARLAVPLSRFTLADQSHYVNQCLEDEFDLLDKKSQTSI